MTMNKFWKIKNEADAEQAEILLYGEINADAQVYREWLGDDTMKSAKMFADDLQELGGKDILLRINSPGGDVFQAQAIYSLLNAYQGDVQCHIDGICASAATVVACAASKITMPQNALFMIHNPAIAMMGMVAADDLEKAKSMLDKVRDSILTVYTKRTDGKLSEEEISTLMDAETWMDAEEAKEHGFIDEIDDYGVAASLTNGNLVVNGQMMTGIAANQQRILKMMQPKKKVVKKVDNDIIAKIKAILNGEQATGPADMANAQERARLEALDALKGENSYVNVLVETAKAENATAEQIKPYLDAVAAVKPKNKALDEIKALIEDQMQSGAVDVKPAPTAGKKELRAAKKQSDIDEVVNLANKMRG